MVLFLICRKIVPKQKQNKQDLNYLEFQVSFIRLVPIWVQTCYCNTNVLTLHIKLIIMDIAIQKKAQSFRLPIDLIERLKKMAKRQNRSLNNFVECALLDIAYSEPNAETKAAIEEAKSGKLQGPLDVSSVEAMYKSMGL